MRPVFSGPPGEGHRALSLDGSSPSKMAAPAQLRARAGSQALGASGPVGRAPRDRPLRGGAGSPLPAGLPPRLRTTVTPVIQHYDVYTRSAAARGALCTQTCGQRPGLGQAFHGDGSLRVGLAAWAWAGAHRSPWGLGGALQGEANIRGRNFTGHCHQPTPSPFPVLVPSAFSWSEAQEGPRGRSSLGPAGIHAFQKL